MKPFELRPAEVQVFLNLLTASGRDPAAFAVKMRADGQVHVTGPQGSAFYSAGNWIARFSRHLDRGFFDPREASVEALRPRP